VIDGLYMVVAFIVALGILIIVHEFGHYWVARRVGVRVLRFSVGFGRPIWRRRWGADQTEFVVSALPFGGYVRMLGEDDSDYSPAEKHRAFSEQSVGKRMAVVVAGPAFNLVFAILAYWVVYMVGIDGLKPVVGQVAETSIAWEAGIRSGDELIAIDGRPVQTWNQHRMYLFQRALDRDTVNVELRTAGGQLATRTLDLSRVPVAEIDAGLVGRGIGLYPSLPTVPAVMGEVIEGPAKSAGLRAGDEIVGVDGTAVQDWVGFATYIRERPGKQVVLEVKRDGARLTLPVVPAAETVGEQTIGRIGVKPQIPELPESMRTRLRFGPGAALPVAIEETWTMSVLTLEMMYRMLKLEVSTRNISGPLTIAQYAGYSAKVGLDRFLMFLAIVSISLGVLNLLPIPVLDGGHLLYYVVEAVTGKPLPERVQAFGQQIGIAILVFLMVLAFYNDITRIFM
jgi:regulator of sigma E protease